MEDRPDDAALAGCKAQMRMPERTTADLLREHVQRAPAWIASVWSTKLDQHR